MTTEMELPFAVFHARADGGETFGFAGAEGIRRASRREIRNGALLRMTVVDAAGRTAQVCEFRVLRRLTPLWQCALMTVFPQWDDIEFEVEFEFEPLPPTTFADLQARLCRSIDANPDEWVDDEALAGEAGAPISLERQLAAAKKVVRAATDLDGIFEGLNTLLRSYDGPGPYAIDDDTE
jgi:hypothetical protein